MGRQRHLKIARRAMRAAAAAEAAALTALLASLPARGNVIGVQLVTEQAAGMKMSRLAALDLPALQAEEVRLQRALMEIPEIAPEGATWDTACAAFYDGMLAGMTAAQGELLKAAEAQAAQEQAERAARAAAEKPPTKKKARPRETSQTASAA